MPLVLISGLPCSGKSQVAAQLAALLASAGQNVIVIDEDSLQLTRNESYRGLPPAPPPPGRALQHPTREGLGQVPLGCQAKLRQLATASDATCQSAAPLC